MAKDGADPRANSEGEPVPDTAEEQIQNAYIDELIEDAQLYATYGRYAGSFKDARLFEAIANTLRERPISNGMVVELQRILNQTAQDIPFSTVAALKAGWTPGRQRLQSTILTVALVLFSILIMVVVARLTLVHNEGQGFIVQAEALLEDKPQQTIDRLIREHVQARLQLEARASSSPNALPLDDTVTMAALEANEIELRDITREVSLLRGNIGEYSAVDAVFPLLGMKEVYCLSGSLLSFDTALYREHCPQPLPEGAVAPDPVFFPQIGNQTCPPALLPSDLPEDMNAMDRWRSILQSEKISLECNSVIASTNFNGVEFQDQLAKIRSQVGYYAVWLLPALYAAMGAVMYHMRWVLDPLLPHPSILKLIHRIVLGSLAGIVLGWFYSPGSAIEEAATGIGFSLFILAFFVGFSLDIFFALMDRFVAMSERSIQGVAERREKEMTFSSQKRDKIDLPVVPLKRKPEPPDLGAKPDPV